MPGLKLRIACENDQRCPLSLRRRIRIAAKAVLDEEQIDGP